MTDHPWTRATTVANTLADRYGLEKWAQRSIVYGIGQREDLYALAASHSLDDKQELGRIAEQALEAAASRSGANLGTALHRLTERIDAGEILDVADQWKPDMDAYVSELSTNHIQVHPEYIERIVVLPELKIAGTLDRIVTANNQLTIADLKTGKHAVEYGAGEIAVQLSLYSRATHMWKGEADTIKRDRYGRYLLPQPDEDPDAYEPMPKVDQTQAIVIHLPAGKGECSLHVIDIEEGWKGVKASMWTREWRKRKDLAHPYVNMAHLTVVEGGDINTDDDW